MVRWAWSAFAPSAEAVPSCQFHYRPWWWPRGRTCTRVVYSSDRDIPPDLFVRNADGTGDEMLLVRSDEVKSASDWSPDGRYGMYEAAPEVERVRGDLWMVDIATKGTQRLTSTPHQEWDARRRTGDRMMYVSGESGRRELYVSAFGVVGARQQVSRAGTTSAGVWTNGGREILSVAPDRSLMAVAVDGLEVGTPRRSGPGRRARKSISRRTESGSCCSRTAAAAIAP